MARGGGEPLLLSGREWIPCYNIPGMVLHTTWLERSPATVKTGMIESARVLTTSRG
jgi:hypothetical protein